VNELQKADRGHWVEVTNRGLKREVEMLTAWEREHFEERAGILEYCSDMERAAAEALALQQTKETFNSRP
jgi:acyl-CoA reductase-like NAD-dependent aldehyde dehydrogenase